MSALFKGYQGLTLISEEPAFDAETGQRQFDVTWAASKAVIFGFANDLEADNVSYRVGNNGPVYFITARVPQNQPIQEDLDRYEISTESQDKSIFEHPTVIEDAATFDAAAASAADTYRKRAEDAVQAQDVGPTATFGSVVRHLKNGVTGFQVDFIVLRRFRKIDLTYAYAAGKFSLDDGSFIYSTAQLNLPANVAFALPATPADPSVDYAWGWKRRGQRVEIVGVYVEQTVELVFAPWSTLTYSNATGPLDW